MFYFVTGLIGLFAVAGTSDANPDFGIPYILFFGTIATIVMGVGVQKLINDWSLRKIFKGMLITWTIINIQ